MDSTLKIVREQGARERQIAALQRSGASKADMDELTSIRSNGQLRDVYDLYEAEKIAEILEGLFPVSSEASSKKGAKK